LSFTGQKCGYRLQFLHACFIHNPLQHTARDCLQFQRSNNLPRSSFNVIILIARNLSRDDRDIPHTSTTSRQQQSSTVSRQHPSIVNSNHQPSSTAVSRQQYLSTVSVLRQPPSTSTVTDLCQLLLLFVSRQRYLIAGRRLCCWRSGQHHSAVSRLQSLSLPGACGSGADHHKDHADNITCASIVLYQLVRHF